MTLPPYEATFTTPDLVKRQIDTDLSTDDDLIIQFIRQASADIISATGRTFVPYYAAEQFNYQYSPLLYLGGRDLLTLISTTDGIGTVNPDNLQLIGAGRYPAFALELINNDYWRWPSGCTTGFITVTGWWGYNINPAKMWKLKTALAEAIDDEAEAFDVADSSGLKVLDYLKVGDEMMQILSIDDPELTVERGMMGTTAADHDDETNVYQYQQKSDIQLATTMLAQFLYQNRDKPGVETVQTAGGGTNVIPLTAPQVARSTISRYTVQRPQIATIRR